jgi:hypothetical protein
VTKRPNFYFWTSIASASTSCHHGHAFVLNSEPFLVPVQIAMSENLHLHDELALLPPVPFVVNTRYGAVRGRRARNGAAVFLGTVDSLSHRIPIDF